MSTLHKRDYLFVAVHQRWEKCQCKQIVIRSPEWMITKCKAFNLVWPIYAFVLNDK